MHLKQIAIQGFKSFPNRTVVEFSHGLTAIVGPNGCGKTNILDALRWVLGEQKPTLLRGAKMDEVIFSGTTQLKPLGMAEVTLTVVNDRGILPTEYHEVQISRRLFRSGESEYLLNKVPCRLKDITDLFVDTGMGAHSYSVIQQHMIDAVISDKAEERRFLFEEAAGITKYKQRRKASLRKLEATENDFLRLKDIYAEVKTRVNSLYRQHKKAERYKKLSDQIRNWELFLGAERLKKLGEEKQKLQAEFDTLDKQKVSQETKLDEAYAQLEKDRHELVEVEQRVASVNSDIQVTTQEAHECEREISVMQEKTANAQLLIEKNTTDNAALTSRAGALKEQSARTYDELDQQQREYDELNTRLSETQSAQAEKDRALHAARLANEERNKQLLELEGKLSSGLTEGDNLQQQLDELSSNITRIEEEMQASLPSQKTLLDEIENLRTQLNGATSQKREKGQRRQQLTQEMEEAVTAGEELALELSSLSASLEACEARKSLLEEMVIQYEGHEAGVVAAMEVKERWPDVIGTVADNFVPVEGMEIVLEAALGDIARFLISRNRMTAREVIGYLKAEGKGKIGILVPSSGTISPSVKRPELNMPGVVGWLDSFVSTDESLRTLKDAVLSRTVVFKAETDPDEILAHLPYGFCAISTDGVLYGGNVITGGSDDHFPLFRRKEKVAEQADAADKLKTEIESAKQKKNQNTVHIGAMRAESSNLSSEIEEHTEEADTLQSSLAECEFKHRTLTAESERLKKEKLNLNTRLEQIRNRQYSLGLDSTELASLKENLVNSMNSSGNRLEDLEKIATEGASGVSQLQVTSIEAKSRLEQTQSQLAHIEEIVGEIDRTRSTKTAEIEQAHKDIELSGQKLTELETRLQACFEKREQHNEQHEGLREVQSELHELTSSREKTAKELRRDKDSAAENLHKTEIQLTTIESERTNLRQKLNEEYHTDVTSEEISYPDEKIPLEEAPELLRTIKEKLDNFGAVNLLALEEYETASEREKFLREQLEDLTTAKNELKSTINKINITARHMFNETLMKVRDNFQKLFVDLFEDGEADICLVDPDDPLESDIDITARPGGKKLLPITVLSGGERALTAISLLFSLYLVKPSPFCILDEIDAPLDDANCRRFLRIIDSFSNQTQFIIITHNKITMQASHNLYGVTMEQAGVSKLVAVKFSQQDGDSDPHLVTIDSAVESLPEGINERMYPEVTITGDDET